MIFCYDIAEDHFLGQHHSTCTDFKFKFLQEWASHKKFTIKAVLSDDKIVFNVLCSKAKF